MIRAAACRLPIFRQCGSRTTTVYYILSSSSKFIAVVSLPGARYVSHNNEGISATSLFLPRCVECRRGLAMRILSLCLSVRLPAFDMVINACYQCENSINLRCFVKPYCRLSYDRYCENDYVSIIRGFDNPRVRPVV